MGAAPRQDWITPYVKEVYGGQIQEFKQFLVGFHGRPNGAGNMFCNGWLRDVIYNEPNNAPPRPASPTPSHGCLSCYGR